MKSLASLIVVRLLPVLFVVAAAMAYVFYVEGDHPYAPRNTLPMFGVLLLALIALVRGQGRWAGSGWRWPLGTLGFAVPALGLSLSPPALSATRDRRNRAPPSTGCRSR